MINVPILIVIGIILFFGVFAAAVFRYMKNKYNQNADSSRNPADDDNLKLMALFSEIDPDPILRIDKNNVIVGANNTAKNEFNEDQLIGSSFLKFVNDFDFYKYDILDDKVVEISDRYYNMSVRKLESMGFSLIYLHDITSRIKYEKEIQNYQNSLKKLRTKLENYNENEKQRVGKELHDSIGQNLSLLRIKVQRFMETECCVNNKDQFNDIIENIDKLSADVRDISQQLCPRILNEFGLAAALSSMIEIINEHSSMTGMLSVNKEINFVPDFEVNLYRMFQEALNNIVKHSDCNTFFIQMVFSDNEFRIIISDDGRGFNIENIAVNGIPSLGLLNMRERAENFGGIMNTETSPNEGTTHFIYFNNIRDLIKNDQNSHS